jgi:hypothetical protein
LLERSLDHQALSKFKSDTPAKAEATRAEAKARQASPDIGSRLAKRGLTLGQAALTIPADFYHVRGIEFSTEFDRLICQAGC